MIGNGERLEILGAVWAGGLRNTERSVGDLQIAEINFITVNALDGRLYLACCFGLIVFSFREPFESRARDVRTSRLF